MQDHARTEPQVPSVCDVARRPQGGVFVNVRCGAAGRIFKVTSNCKQIYCAPGNKWTNVKVMEPTLRGGLLLGVTKLRMQLQPAFHCSSFSTLDPSSGR